MDIKSKIMELTFRPLTEDEYREYAKRLDDLWADVVAFPTDLPVRHFSENNDENSALYQYISNVLDRNRIKFFFFTLKNRYNRFDVFVCHLHRAHSGKLLPLISWTDLKLSQSGQSKESCLFDRHPLFPPHAVYL